MITRIASCVVLPLLLLAQPAAAQDAFQDPSQARFSYAVKFVCSPDNGSLEEGILPGVYGTAINVHNPFLDREVRYFKKFVRGFVNQVQGEPTAFQPEDVQRNHALEVECFEILAQLGNPSTATGYVVFLTRRPLDITAVYTAGPREGDVASIDVEKIEARRLPNTAQ
jgi:hypothetical protein